MELLQLKYFKLVASLEHITRASELLNISQPALSKTIRSLETELNTKLFNRNGKNIVLNSNGKIFLKYVTQVLQCLEDAKLALSDSCDSIRQPVHLSMNAASKLLPDMLIEFKKLYPGIQFAITQHSLSSDTADLIIDSTKEPLIAANTITLLKEEILVALPKDHRLANQKEIELSDIAGENFIGLQKGKSLRDITTQYCRQCGFEPKVILESDDPATIRGLINVGLGIAFLPAITWAGVADENIRLLHISNLHCYRYINLTIHKEGYLPSNTSTFMEFLLKYFATL